MATLVALASLAACSATPPLPPPPRGPAPVPWPPPLPAQDPPTETPDAPFRDRVPEAGPPVVFHPPRVEAFALKNGVRVLFVERRELPLVSVRVVARTGAGELGMRPGQAAFLGAMIDQGTESKSALAISDAILSMGAQHAAWVDWDSGQITIEALATQVDAGVALLGDLALHASFPPDEIARLKARWAASLKAERTSAVAASGNAIAAALYGRGHPYGHSLYGKADDVVKATRDELVAAWRRELAPSNVTIVAAGDLTRAALAPKLEAAFGGLKGAGAGAGAPARAKVPAPRPGAARLVIVDHAGAKQSQIAVTEVGVPYAVADRDALAVMNAILGGMFSSRVNMNLREAHAYTYDARSRFAQRHGAGPFTAGGAVATEATAAAVKEVLLEIAKMRDGDVSPEELADAKELLARGLPARFETLNDVTGALAEIAIHDLPTDDFATRQARIAAVTAADVRRAAQAHLHPGKATVVIVGDRKAIDPSLAGLGLGAPVVLDAYGDPAP